MSYTATILVVDDVEANRDVLESLVKRLGHIAISVDGGVGALEVLQEKQIDLVLLDIMMPEIDGFEVLSNIKDDVRLRHIPVIMISALDDMENIVESIKMGAEDYLSKPFNRTLLKARISASLERKYLRDKEEEYLQKIEGYNKNLERLVQEKTIALEKANERLRILNEEKGDALQFVLHQIHSPVKTLLQSVKGIFKDGLDDANKVLDMIKASSLFTQIDLAETVLPFDINTVHVALNNAVAATKEFATSRQVMLGEVKSCNEKIQYQELTRTFVDPELMHGSEMGGDIDVLPVNVYDKDDENSKKQRELCTKALEELLKTAVRYSNVHYQIELECDATKNNIIIYIHAYGRIIPEEDLARFFEVPSPNNPIAPGRNPGLGPSAAQHIIKMLDGKVDVENRNDEGITFIITLRGKSFR